MSRSRELRPGGHCSYPDVARSAKSARRCARHNSFWTARSITIQSYPRALFHLVQFYIGRMRLGEACELAAEVFEKASQQTHDPYSTQPLNTMSVKLHFGPVN
jgi:hypothetical protein